MRKPVVALVTVLAIALAALVPTVASAASGTVSGTLTFAGQAVSSGTVGWFDPVSGNYGASTVQSNGSYTLTPSGSYLLFAGIERTGTGWTQVDPSRVGLFYGANGASDYLWQGLTEFPASTTAATLDMHLDAPGSIAGSAKSFARHYIQLLDLGGDTIRSVKADASGAFVFGELIPGRYQLRTDAGHGFTAWTSPAVPVAAGQSVALPVTLVAGATLSGRITAHGSAVRGVLVTASTATSFGGQVVTDKHGRYSIAELAAGTYSVTIGGTMMSAPQSGGGFGDTGSPGAVAKVVGARVAAGATTTKNVHVTRGGAVSTHLTLSKGSGYYTVAIVDSHKRLITGGNESGGTTNPVTFFGLKSGTYSIYATEQKSGRYATSTFRVKAGATTKLAALRFTHKTVTLTGTVGGDADRVGIISKGSARYITVRDHRFVARGVIPGAVAVTVQGQKSVDATTSITLRHSATRSFATGPALVPVTGTFVLDGVAVSNANGTFSKSDGQQFYFVERGTLTGATFPGTSTMSLDSLDTGFVKNAPFWVTLPLQVQRISATAPSVDLGVVQLVVNR